MTGLLKQLSSKGSTLGSLSAIPPGPKFKKGGAKTAPPKIGGQKPLKILKNFEVGNPVDAPSAILSEIT